MKSDQIRRAFLTFFEERGHRAVSSSPLVPPDDPTLLFTTAGMVQFKPLYSGVNGELPYSRAATVQKCMRAGGKGSDLENVGRTIRHHTFFEMLGNFSFGDYFKRDALNFAWEFSTKVAGLDPERCFASVYEDDDEAWDIWTKEIGLPESRMVRLGAKDNFWGPAGDTGACGPCSELYYDRGEEHGPGLSFQDATRLDDDPGSRYLEFWNCVFPQFDQQKDGSRPALKNRGVDTGMSVERLAMLTQNVDSLYQTDTMAPVIEAVRVELGLLATYEDLPVEARQALNVVADHVRALTFVMGEGILPGNEGRGYVMRRLLRRAARYAGRLGHEKPFLHKIVDSVVASMGEAYPEIRATAAATRRVIKTEEESFATTLASGLQRLDTLLAGRSDASAPLDGDDVFQLTATYGLPYDDIVEIAADRGVSIDTDSYLAHVAKHREESRKGAKGARFEGIYEALKALRAEHGPTEFLGYPPDFEDMDDGWDEALEDGDWEEDDGDDELLPDDLSLAEGRIVDLGLHRRGGAGDDDDDNSEVDETLAEQVRDLVDSFDEPYPLTTCELGLIGLFKGDEAVSMAREGDEVAAVFDRTLFYAEGGGQVGDTGVVDFAGGRLDVRDTAKTGEDMFVHYGVVVSGEIAVGQTATARLDDVRRLAIMRHHTATHIMQGAMKRVIGPHVTQQGSFVGPDNLRFDFTNPEAVTPEQIAEIERMVNEQVMADQSVVVRVLPLEEAKSLPGVIAPFGEKYAQEVRVVEIPDWDTEFCGGTHVLATGQVGPFLVTSESAVAAGVRRIEAVAGGVAVELMQRERAQLKRIARDLKAPREKVEERLAALHEELAATRRQVAQMRAKAIGGEVENLLLEAPETNGVKVVTHRFDGVDGKGLREAYDVLKNKRPNGLVAVLGSVEEGGKVNLVAGATADAIERGVSAGDLIKKLAPMVGGSGGGKKDVAQAGGKQPEGLAGALDEARKLVGECLTV